MLALTELTLVMLFGSFPITLGMGLPVTQEEIRNFRPEEIKACSDRMLFAGKTDLGKIMKTWMIWTESSIDFPTISVNCLKSKASQPYVYSVGYAQVHDGDVVGTAYVCWGGLIPREYILANDLPGWYNLYKGSCKRDLQVKGNDVQTGLYIPLEDWLFIHINGTYYMHSYADHPFFPTIWLENEVTIFGTQVSITNNKFRNLVKCADDTISHALSSGNDIRETILDSVLNHGFSGSKFFAHVRAVGHFSDGKTDLNMCILFAPGSNVGFVASEPLTCVSEYCQAIIPGYEDVDESFFWGVFVAILSRSLTFIVQSGAWLTTHVTEVAISVNGFIPTSIIAYFVHARSGNWFITILTTLTITRALQLFGLNIFN